jgi:hypothetical protein
MLLELILIVHKRFEKLFGFSCIVTVRSQLLEKRLLLLDPGSAFLDMAHCGSKGALFVVSRRAIYIFVQGRFGAYLNRVDQPSSCFPASFLTRPSDAVLRHALIEADRRELKNESPATQAGVPSGRRASVGRTAAGMSEIALPTAVSLSAVRTSQRDIASLFTAWPSRPSGGRGCGRGLKSAPVSGRA